MWLFFLLSEHTNRGSSITRHKRSYFLHFIDCAGYVLIVTNLITNHYAFISGLFVLILADYGVPAATGPGRCDFMDDSL